MKNTSLLVVEDEAVLAFEMVGMLKKQGCLHCESVPTGERALEYLEQNKVDCVLMDIVMPGPLDGIETARIIKAGYDIPIIFITAYSEEKDMKRAGEVAPYGYVQKPIKDYELVYVIETAMQHYRTEKRLRENEEMFRLFFDGLKNPISILDLDLNVIMMNETSLEYIEKSREQVAGVNMKELLPDFADDLRRNIAEHGHSGSLFSFESKVSLPVGNLWFMSTVNFLKEKVLGQGAIQVVCYDITSRKAYEESIRRSLVEKELLIKEIHHRVKNNMQIISSLLDLQYESIVNIRDREVFLNSQNRVRSMALVHEKLYRSDNISRIEFRDYIEGLIQEYRETLSSVMDRVVFHMDSDDIYLDINQAIPCALILNELATNSLKHAFPDGRSGTVDISFREKTPGNYELTVGDDGIGLPEDFNIGSVDTLGLQLVEVLTEQLKGVHSMERHKGIINRITFGGQSAGQMKKRENENRVDTGEGRKRILIVEDERITAMHVKGLLEKAGYHVAGTVTSGEMVMDAVEREKPDLVLMDIFLEDGMDGITAVEEIRGRYDVPVIYATANTDELVMKRAAATNPSGYIDKPIDKVDLINAIEKALGN